MGRHALLIGTSEYTSLPNVPESGHDALGVATILATPDVGDYKTSVVNDLRSAEIASRLDEFLTQAQDSDAIIVYYSGHGLVSDSGGLHLAGVDSDLTNPTQTSYSVEALSHLLTECAASSVVVLLDCCYSGRALIGPQTLVKSADAVAASATGFDRQRVALTSSTDVELAHFNADGSVFTKSIIDGLHGAADLNADGLVDAEELYLFASSRVRGTVQGQAPAFAMAGGSQPPVLVRSPSLVLGDFRVPSVFVQAAGGLHAARKLLGVPTDETADLHLDQTIVQRVEGIIAAVAAAREVWDERVVATWLRSRSGFLSGARPIDTLVMDGPGDVLSALEAEASGAYS